VKELFLEWPRTAGAAQALLNTHQRISAFEFDHHCRSSQALACKLVAMTLRTGCA